MMNFDQIFKHYNLIKVGQEEESCYEKPGSPRFYVRDSYRFMHFHVISEADGLDREVTIYHVIHEEYISSILHLLIRTCLNRDFALLNPENFYNIFVKYIRKAIGEEFTDREIDNICFLYDQSVRDGYMNQPISFICREIILILSMETSPYIEPELHRLLLKVPDVYFDFISGMELNLACQEEFQHKVIDFLKNHPGLYSSEIIIFSSLLNYDLNTDKKEVWDIILNYRKNRLLFRTRRVNMKYTEFTRYMNVCDWRIVTFYTDDKTYTLRHAGNLVLIDYTAVCIAYGMIDKFSEDTVRVFRLKVSDKSGFDGVKEQLLFYLERMAATSNFRWMLSEGSPEETDFYLSRGYGLSESRGEKLLFKKNIEGENT